MFHGAKVRQIPETVCTQISGIFYNYSFYLGHVPQKQYYIFNKMLFSLSGFSLLMVSYQTLA